MNIAEAIAFEVYGKSMIKDERPYYVNLVNDRIWIISGSINYSFSEKIISILSNMPKLGGGFEIKIDAKDGKIIKVIHYK